MSIPSRDMSSIDLGNWRLIKSFRKAAGTGLIQGREYRLPKYAAAGRKLRFAISTRNPSAIQSSGFESSGIVRAIPEGWGSVFMMRLKIPNDSQTPYGFWLQRSSKVDVRRCSGDLRCSSLEPLDGLKLPTCVWTPVPPTVVKSECESAILTPCRGSKLCPLTIESTWAAILRCLHVRIFSDSGGSPDLPLPSSLNTPLAWTSSIPPFPRWLCNDSLSCVDCTRGSKPASVESMI